MADLDASMAESAGSKESEGAGFAPANTGDFESEDDYLIDPRFPNVVLLPFLVSHHHDLYEIFCD